MIGTLVTPTTTSIMRPLVLNVPCVLIVCEILYLCVLCLCADCEIEKGVLKKEKFSFLFATYQKPNFYLFAIVVPCCGYKPAKEDLSKKNIFPLI